jgi:ubiquinone/menaquinone biosynthesis C-methylase UbiE
LRSGLHRYRRCRNGSDLSMKNYFSEQAKIYAQYRPDYPSELFEFVLQYVNDQNAAWDCATGNGQTAKILAQHFKKVEATDISQQQLDEAVVAKNIHYSKQPAEQTDFPSDCFDLVTASQALHWFKFDEFYKEVKRVSKPGGIFAAWMYNRQMLPVIDKIIEEDLYNNILGDYWDPARKLVDENYSTIPFPFEEIRTPVFTQTLYWSHEQLRGYLNSWSAVRKFISQNDYNPVDEVMKKILPLWQGEKMRVEFPIHMRIGRVKK